MREGFCRRRCMEIEGGKPEDFKTDGRYGDNRKD
jgi:hypothetical protein